MGRGRRNIRHRTLGWGRGGYFSPKEIGAEEGDGPAVAVLLINRPLGAQVVYEDRPVAGEGEEIEERGQGREGANFVISDQ